MKKRILLSLFFTYGSAFAQVDMSLFSDMKARSIGPAGMSGRIAAIDAVVARSVAEAGPDAVDVVCILDLQMKYLVAIGAVGDAAD